MSILLDTAITQQQRLPGQPPSYDSGTRAFTWTDTESGELHYTHHPSGIFEMCGCKKPHDGIPCLIDRLIWDKRYRRKFRQMIQRDEGTYLLAAAQLTVDRTAAWKVAIPTAYFADICSKHRWDRTKRDIIRKGLHKRFELRDERMVHEIDVERKFRAKVDWQEHPDACDLWTKALDKDGYGRHYVNGKEVRAHRWWYQFNHGPIPDDWDVDHTCGVRHCMKHLVAKPRDVNRGRTQNPGPRQSDRTQLINKAVRDTSEARACRVPMCEGEVIGFLIVKGTLVNICAEHSRDSKYEFVARMGPASQAFRRNPQVIRLDDGIFDDLLPGDTPSGGGSYDVGTSVTIFKS
jgi:hypothetical protein